VCVNLTVSLSGNCVSLDVKESKIDFFVQNVKLLIVCKESFHKEIFYMESVISARL